PVVRLHPFRGLLVAASLPPFALAAVAGGPTWPHGAQQQDLRWAAGGRAPLVSAVTSGAPADGKLHVGDRVIAIDDDPRVSELGVRWKLRSLRPDERYRVDVDRGGA